MAGRARHSALEAGLAEAASGIDGELVVEGASVPVRPVDDEIEVVLGPLVVFGTEQDWKATMERERSEAERTTAAPPTSAEGWRAGPSTLPRVQLRVIGRRRPAASHDP